MAGTLYICSVKDMNQFEHINKKFVVARKYPYNSLDELRAYGWDWKYYLAPNKTLYNETMRAKKAGMFNDNYFKNIYCPAYRRQLKEQKSSDALAELVNLLLSNEDVVIACWCTDKFMCHTFCIAQEYKNIGGNVVMLNKGLLQELK